MNGESLALLAGAAIAGGLLLLVITLRPAPPDLGTVLAPVASDGAAKTRPHATVLPVPYKHLTLIGRSADQFRRSLLVLALLGLLFPSLVGFALIVIGIRIPLAIPAVAGLVIAALFVLVGYRDVAQTAARAKVDFRRAVADWLDLIAVERRSGQAPIAALERAARVGENWAFQRIRTLLDQSRQRMTPPWADLAALATELDVPELGDVGRIIEMAGGHGAQVADTLALRAQQLRDQDQAEQLKQARRLAAQMEAPAALLLGLVLAVFLYAVLSGIAA